MNHSDAKYSKRYQQGVLFKEKLYSGFMTDIFGITQFCYCSQNIFYKNSNNRSDQIKHDPKRTSVADGEIGLSSKYFFCLESSCIVILL